MSYHVNWLQVKAYADNFKWKGPAIAENWFYNLADRSLYLINSNTIEVILSSTHHVNQVMSVTCVISYRKYKGLYVHYLLAVSTFKRNTFTFLSNVLPSPPPPVIILEHQICLSLPLPVCLHIVSSPHEKNPLQKGWRKFSSKALNMKKRNW